MATNQHTPTDKSIVLTAGRSSVALGMFRFTEVCNDVTHLDTTDCFHKYLLWCKSTLW